MKINYLIFIVITLGIITLFFFPSPEDNFLAYLGVAFFFVIVIFLIIKFQVKNKIHKRP